MSVRMRHTSGHTRNRRSHHALDAIKAVPGEKEGTLRLPHRLDEASGMYRGRQIVPVKESRAPSTKVKGPDTEALAAHEPEHEHAHVEHENAQAKSSRGVSGKAMPSDRPRSRSGMGGGS